MPRSGQHPSPLSRLIQRTLIPEPLQLLKLLRRSQHQQGELRIELLGQGLSQEACLEVPASAFKVKAGDDGCVFDLEGQGGLVEEVSGVVGRVGKGDFVVEFELVDVDSVLSGVVLEDGGEETLSEEEA